MLEWINNVTNGHVSEAIIIASAIVILHVLISIYMACNAKQKGYNDTLHFFVCLLFGILGYIYVAALPDRRLHYKIEKLYSIIDELANDFNFNAEGLLAETEDSRKPAGTTAYMPRSITNSETSTPAVERIKGYWEKSKKKEDVTKKTKKKKEKKKNDTEKKSFD